MLPLPVHEHAARLAHDIADHYRHPAGLEDALKALLINAVMHRSYSPVFHDRSIQVRQYTNAICIQSPGLPTEHLSFDQGRPQGVWARNPRLAKRLVADGYARLEGLGVARAIECARRAGWSVCVEPDTSTQSVHAWLRITPESIRPMRPEGARDRLDEREPQIVSLLQDGRPRSAAEIARDLGMADSSTRAVLKRLLEKGRVLQTQPGSPRSPTQRYTIAASST